MRKIILLTVALLALTLMSSCEALDAMGIHIHKFEGGVCTGCGELDEDYYSKGLTYFSLGDGTCRVGISNNCTDEHIVIPPRSEKGVVVEIDEAAFHERTDIKSVVIPDTVTKIDEYAFIDCTSLESIVIPDSVTEIGNYAFARCTSLKSIRLPKDLKVINTEVFWGCSDLESVVFPEALVGIGEYAFSKCIGLKSIEITTDMVELANGAFWGCVSLENVKITATEGYLGLGSYAFSGCTGLKSIKIDAEEIHLGTEIFWSCSSLTEAKLDGLVAVNPYMFFGCLALKEIDIPDCAKYIGYNAFENCLALRTVRIPKSIETIGHDAFKNCPSLSEIIFEGTVEEWNAIDIRYSDEQGWQIPATQVQCSDGTVELSPSGGSTVTPEDNSLTVGSDIGQKCPAYSLNLIDGSGTVNIEDFKGKIVVINLWGTWCGPCKSEMPDFDKVATDYDGEVVVLAVHSVPGSANAPDYIAENFPESKILFAYDEPLTNATDVYFDLVGGTSYYPRTLVLDERGVICFAQDGKVSHQQLVDTIEQIKNK